MEFVRDIDKSLRKTNYLRMIDQIPKVPTIFSTLVNANGVRLDVYRYRDDFLSTTDEHNRHVTQWVSVFFDFTEPQPAEVFAQHANKKCK